MTLQTVLEDIRKRPGSGDVIQVIDPTTEDTWLRDSFASRPYVKKGEESLSAYERGAKGEPR